MVAAVGSVNGLQWIVHFDHDSQLHYKIASLISTYGRVIELIILIHNSKYNHVMNDIESQLPWDTDNKSDDNVGGKDNANENTNALILLGWTICPEVGMDAPDSTMGARNFSLISSHNLVAASATSPTISTHKKLLKVNHKN